jgi:two-component system chemotaxis response regulator CheB
LAAVRKIKVLLADDAIVVRRVLSETLSQDPALELLQPASTGRAAVQRVEQSDPDIVILDVEMPDMNGLEALAAIRKQHPKLPVIMFSSLTRKGASATIEALARGASDYVTKPDGSEGVNAAIQAVRDVLLPKIHSLAGVGVGQTGRPGSSGFRSPGLRNQAGSVPANLVPRPGTELRPNLPAVAIARRIDLVVIGASTGGPNALGVVLSALPPKLPVPVLVVQHMPKMFTRLLAERLNTQVGFPVREALDRAPLAPGEVWIAQGDEHLLVERAGADLRTRFDHGPLENSTRPALDPLFRSAADLFGERVLGVVLTGMGQDGLSGSERIRQRGGQIIAQDEATSVVWGMPGFVARAGIANRVLPLEQIGPEITQRIWVGRATGTPPRPTSSSTERRS